MSRQGAPRTLSLTEELERLEQQITLTLQEIDSNFSQAHRIVTSSIIPVVEEYAKHSNDIWEGSKFWKQFFEASANVSLSGYEEAAADEDVTRADDTSTSLHTPTDHGESSVSRTDLSADDEDDDDFTLDSPTQVSGAQSTPKLPASTVKSGSASGRKENVKSSSFRRSPSPRKYTGKNPLGEPSTPRQKRQDDVSSPFEAESTYQASVHAPVSQQRGNNDPLLHRIMDKNYRVQATPHTQTRNTKPSVKATPATATKTRPWDDSPGSSPELPAPQLRSDLFSPPPGRNRTPGVSVLTPARHRDANGKAPPITSTGRQLFSPKDKVYANIQQTRTSRNMFSDDDDGSDDDDIGGMSPPKTIQFHVPQSRLVQTPAREASRRIVEDLLLTAGAEDTDEIEGASGFEGEMDEGSPSIVRRVLDVDDDTF